MSDPNLSPTPLGLQVGKLDQHYGSSHVLRGIDLSMAPGECLALLGRNGAGKTTLLRCLMGLLPTTRGTVQVDGVEIGKLATHHRSRLGLAYVPQGREIFGELTVKENLLAAARAHGLEGSGSIDEAVALFPALRTLWNRAGGNLSGGQQQQLAIARALATRPRALLLDEPTEGIQPSIVGVIEEVIAGLNGRISILLVEQYLDFAIRLADSFVVLVRGAVVESGRADAMSHAGLSRHIAV